MGGRPLLVGLVVAVLVLGGVAFAAVRGPRRPDGAAGPGGDAGPPNVLVVVTDDARAETLQVMPRTRRWLADGGVTFTQGFATTPSCCPSRASILSGRYVHNHGVLRQQLGDRLDAEFERDDARPWFLYLAPFAPHDPRIPEPRYAAASFPDLERVGGGGEAEVAGAPAYLRQRAPADPGEVAALRTGQARTLLSVDDLLDRVMGRLQATGELDDTLVFYLSDNGYSWGEHRHVGKFVPHTESIKVPFLVRGSWRLPAGTVDDRLVATELAAASTCEGASCP